MLTYSVQQVHPGYYLGPWGPLGLPQPQSRNKGFPARLFHDEAEKERERTRRERGGEKEATEGSEGLGSQVICCYDVLSSLSFLKARVS